MDCQEYASAIWRCCYLRFRTAGGGLQVGPVVGQGMRGHSQINVSYLSIFLVGDFKYCLFSAIPQDEYVIDWYFTTIFGMDHYHQAVLIVGSKQVSWCLYSEALLIVLYQALSGMFGSYCTAPAPLINPTKYMFGEFWWSHNSSRIGGGSCNSALKLGNLLKHLDVPLFQHACMPV